MCVPIPPLSGPPCQGVPETQTYTSIHTDIVHGGSLQKSVRFPTHVRLLREIREHVRRQTLLQSPDIVVPDTGRKFLSHQFTFLDRPIFLVPKMN
jgi:hypothetical protein